MAVVAMPTMPATADALTDLPLLLGWRNRCDITDDLVARNQGVLCLREEAVLGGLVAVRDGSALSIAGAGNLSGQSFLRPKASAMRHHNHVTLK